MKWFAPKSYPFVFFPYIFLSSFLCFSSRFFVDLAPHCPPPPSLSLSLHLTKPSVSSDADLNNNTMHLLYYYFNDINGCPLLLFFPPSFPFCACTWYGCIHPSMVGQPTKYITRLGLPVCSLFPATAAHEKLKRRFSFQTMNNE